MQSIEEFKTQVLQENQYLREQIEHVKFSKDRTGYDQFVKGLIQLKPKEIEPTLFS